MDKGEEVFKKIEDRQTNFNKTLTNSRDLFKAFGKEKPETDEQKNRMEDKS